MAARFLAFVVLEAGGESNAEVAMSKILQVSYLMLLGWAVIAQSAERNNCQVEIFIDGRSAPEFAHAGVTYIEALKGREYAIRLTNPFGVRVAVALSVDGLNTIDARHTEAYAARKWVLGPYESVTIRGWQTNSRQARRFFFTTEEESYGNWLNKKENLGIISAVFFREKPQWLEQPPQPLTSIPQPGRARTDKQSNEARSAEASAAPTKDEFAATGIGRNIQNDVRWISMDLESSPAATVNVRYEFRPILTRLGIFPPTLDENLIYRRQHARGFKDTGYCPDPR
jgi:hypothetical protein